VSRVSVKEIEVYNDIPIYAKGYMKGDTWYTVYYYTTAGGLMDRSLEGLKAKIDSYLIRKAQLRGEVYEPKKKEEEEVDMIRVGTGVTVANRPIGFAEGGWHPQEPIVGQRSRPEIRDVKKLSAEGVKEEFPWTWLIIAGVGLVILLVLLK